MLGLGNSIAHSSYVSGATPKLLDTVGGAVGAYSLRLLDSSYGGNAVNVRRDSDNAEAEIGFAGGELDTKALSDHCGSANGFVDTWLDQSGNGNDITQATADNQPKIYDGSAVESTMGKPSVRFIAASTTYLDGLYLTNQTTSTYFSVEDRNGTNYNSWAPDWGDNTIVTHGDVYAGGWLVGVRAFDAGWLQRPGAAPSIQDERLIYWLRDGSGSELGVNGSSVATGTQDTASHNRLRLGTRAGLTTPNNGYISEFIMYATDQSDNRADIESDMNDFYSIY